MFICRECGAVSEELHRKCFDDLDTMFQGYTMVCPFCHSDEVEDAVECEKCGKYVAEDELTEGLCTECEIDIRNKVFDFFEQFSEVERKYIFESGILEEF